ncbi:MAG: hypothetical protein LQ349_000954 [Xanthoria aureola]|nr:MAG: hypothetical protein LQ349_000954 [Xanthoria aureola]
MSLPGLQLSASDEPVLSAVVHHLSEGSEWRFEVAFGSTVEIKLLSGNAELFGTELAQKQTYSFSGTKAAIYTWHGCSIEVAGECQVEYLAEETPMISYANLHFALERKREEAVPTGQDGPRVLVLGPEDAGKTSLVKLLTAYATHSGRQPVTVNLDPKEGILSVPGSLSAVTFSSILDVEEGWGSSPVNGPSPIPVMLPLVYYYGQANADSGDRIYKPIVTRLAVAVLSKLQDDRHVGSSGCLIDTPGAISQGGKGGYDIIQHIVSEFSVNVLVVVGSERLYSDMLRRFNGQPIGIGETTTVIKLDRSGGSVDRDEDFLRRSRKAQFLRYFYGDPKMELHPRTTECDFSHVSIYRVPDTTNTENLTTATSDFLASLLPGGEAEDDAATQRPIYEKVAPSPQMQNGILAVVQADVNDTPEHIRDASVIGFVQITEVDEKRKKLRILPPIGLQLPRRALIWGSWPSDLGELVR